MEAGLHCQLESMGGGGRDTHLWVCLNFQDLKGEDAPLECSTSSDSDSGIKRLEETCLPLPLDGEGVCRGGGCPCHPIVLHRHQSSPDQRQPKKSSHNINPFSELCSSRGL